MAADGAAGGFGVFSDFGARLRERRKRAARMGDQASVVRYDAMLAVLRTKLIPLVCPEAVTLAGDAARAAHEGCSEEAWLRAASVGRERTGGEMVALFRAVRLMKTAGIWPWTIPAGPGGPVVQHVDPASEESTAAQAGDAYAAGMELPR